MTMNLVDAMRREYGAAKICWAGVYSLQVLGVALAAAAGIATDASALLKIGVASMLVPLFSFALKEHAGAKVAQGERIRRLHVLQDGLGKAPPPAELADLQADATGIPALEPTHVGTYFDSSITPGYRRLAHITEEAAFFTWKTAKRTSAWCAAGAVAGCLATFTFLWVALQVANVPPTPLPASTGAPLPLPIPQVAKLVSIIFAFFVSGTFATLWRSFGALSRSAEATYKRCEVLRNERAPEQLDVLVAVGSYDTAVAKAPPIPTTVYRLMRDRLNAAWKTHMSLHPDDAIPNASPAAVEREKA